MADDGSFEEMKADSELQDIQVPPLDIGNLTPTGWPVPPPPMLPPQRPTPAATHTVPSSESQVQPWTLTNLQGTGLVFLGLALVGAWLAVLLVLFANATIGALLAIILGGSALIFSLLYAAGSILSRLNRAKVAAAPIPSVSQPAPAGPMPTAAPPSLANSEYLWPIGRIVTFPSGWSITVSSGEDASHAEASDYFDPNYPGTSRNPLLDSSNAPTSNPPLSASGRYLLHDFDQGRDPKRIDPAIVDVVDRLDAVLRKLDPTFDRLQINQGYRSYKRERELRAPKPPLASRHCSGQAVDIQAAPHRSGFDMARLALAVQLELERNGSSVHLGIGFGQSALHLDVGRPSFLCFDDHEFCKRDRHVDVHVAEIMREYRSSSTRGPT